MGRHIPGNDSAGGDDRAAANRHTFQDGDIHADPDMVADDDRLGHRPVGTDEGMVITVPDGDILTDDDALPDGNALKATEA